MYSNHGPQREGRKKVLLPLEEAVTDISDPYHPRSLAPRRPALRSVEDASADGTWMYVDCSGNYLP